MLRAADRLTEEITSRKQRIRDLGRQWCPDARLGPDRELARSRASPVLVRWPHPSLLCAGHAAVARYVTHVSRGSLDATQRADGWVHAAREAVALDGDNPAVLFADGARRS